MILKEKLPLKVTSSRGKNVGFQSDLDQFLAEVKNKIQEIIQFLVSVPLWALRLDLVLSEFCTAPFVALVLIMTVLLGHLLGLSLV